jgi:hypothetical protein
MTQEKDYMKVKESSHSPRLQNNYANTAIPAYFNITSYTNPAKKVIGMSGYH